MTDFPANTWEVWLEVRKQGAIGAFYPFMLRVRAWPEKVNEWAVDDAHYLGYETRGLISKQRIA